MQASQPKKAAPSIMPSMPMLTTPARSHHRPESAPSVRGVATAIVVASMLVMMTIGGVLRVSNCHDNSEQDRDDQGNDCKAAPIHLSLPSPVSTLRVLRRRARGR